MKYSTVEQVMAALPRQRFADPDEATGEKGTSPSKSDLAALLADVEAEVDLTLRAAAVPLPVVDATSLAALRSAVVDLTSARMRYRLAPAEAEPPEPDAVPRRVRAVIESLTAAPPAAGGGLADGPAASPASPPVVTMTDRWDPPPGWA